MKNTTKIKICELLGAKKFRKLVFIIEKLKYKIIYKFFPNITNWYEKRCIISMNKELKKCKSDKEKKQTISKYQKEILLFKKEILEKQNRNYHIDINHPTKILEHLENNKKIHKNGLIGNIIILLLNFIFLSKFTIIFNIINIYQIISAIINLECINLQNYHLYIYKETKQLEKIKKIENIQNNKNFKKYKNASNAVKRVFDNTTTIPTINDLVDEIKSKDEAIELLEYAKRKLKSKEKEKKLKKEKD